MQPSGFCRTQKAVFDFGKGRGNRMLWKLIQEFGLDAGLCFLDKTGSTVKDDVEIYNEKVTAAINFLQQQKETFVIKEEEKNTESYILVEHGKFYGMGSWQSDMSHKNLEDLKPRLTQYPENEIIKSMLSSFAEKNPNKVLRYYSL